MLLQFRNDATTTAVADTLGDIGRTLASDSYDAGRFMVWREEQRAIAEEMRDNNEPLGCIGYATFVQRYDEAFASWFASFDHDLDADAAVRSQRLQLLQRHLAELARRLDSERAHEEQWKRLLANAERTR